MKKKSARKVKATQKNIRKITEQAARACAEIVDRSQLPEKDITYLSTFIAIAIEVFSRTDPAVFKDCVTVTEIRSHLLKLELQKESKND